MTPIDQDGLSGIRHVSPTFLLHFMSCLCDFREVGDIRFVCAPHLAVVRKYQTVDALY